MKHVLILKAQGTRGWFFYWDDVDDFSPSQFDHNELVWKLIVDFLEVAPAGFIGGDLIQYVSEDLYDKLRTYFPGEYRYDVTDKMSEYIAEFRDNEF